MELDLVHRHIAKAWDEVPRQQRPQLMMMMMAFARRHDVAGSSGQKRHKGVLFMQSALAPTRGAHVDVSLFQAPRLPTAGHAAGVRISARSASWAPCRPSDGFGAT